MSRCNLRSSTTEKELSDPIPIDLLIDIFSRVPAKCIARFRCVSKFWASILGRPDFTELFLTKSSSRPRILFNFRVQDKLFFYSTDQPDENSSLVATPYGTYSTKGSESVTCGSLRGFISFQGYRQCMICNPVTGEFLTLPVVETEYCDMYTYLGYDPIDKTFKVLHMTRNSFHSIDIEHRVLTLDSGKQHLWRTIQCCKPHYPRYTRICIDGVLYYRARVERFADKDKSMIACFDIRSEKFSFINMDQSMVIEIRSTLINYKGKLGVVQFQSSNFYQRILELWVLEDTGKHKWSKHIYALPLTWKSQDALIDMQIVGMTSTCEIVFSPYFLSNCFYVFYYDLESKIIRKVRIKGLVVFKDCRVHICLDYVEDLKLILK